MVLSKSLMPKGTTLSNDLPSKAAMLASRQIIEDLTESRENDAVTRINPGKVINHFPIPKKITINLHNTTGGILSTKFFNASTLNAATNGVTTTYSDGFSGRQLENLFKTLDGGSGLLIFGFNVSGTNADGEKSDDVLNDAALKALYFTGDGDTSIPEAIDIAGSERNTQVKEGLFTVKVQMLINTLMQMQATLGAGCKLQFVFFTSPIRG